MTSRSRLRPRWRCRWPSSPAAPGSARWSTKSSNRSTSTHPTSRPPSGPSCSRRPSTRSGTSTDDAFVAGIVAAMQTPLGPNDTDPRLCDLDPARLLGRDAVRPPDPNQRPGRTARRHRRRLRSAPRRGRSGASLRRPPPQLHSSQVPWLSQRGDRPDCRVAHPAGPRFVVVDYKSNALPMLGEDPSPADYGPGPLDSVMLSSNYVLQATLYQVALHRYLQWRLPGYDPSGPPRRIDVPVRARHGRSRHTGDRRRTMWRRSMASARLVRRRRQRPVQGRPAMTAVDRVRRRLADRRVRSSPPMVCSPSSTTPACSARSTCSPRRPSHGYSDETDERVILAAAMAVRGTRFGHVCISLSALREAIVVDGQDPEVIEALPWPDPSAWESVVAGELPRR